MLIVVGTLLPVNAGSMFIRSSSGVGNKLIANAANKIVVVIDAAIVFTRFGSSKKFVPWLFLFQQVGFELLGNLAGLKWSKKDLDLWHTAATEVFKNRFEVLLIFALG